MVSAWLHWWVWLVNCLNVSLSCEEHESSQPSFWYVNHWVELLLQRVSASVLRLTKRFILEKVPTLYICRHINSPTSGWLTCAVVIAVAAPPRFTADAQEGFVVIVLIPVKGGHAGESAFGVTAHQSGGSSHQLPKGQIVLEEGSHHLEELLGAVPLVQLWRFDKTSSVVPLTLGKFLKWIQITPRKGIFQRWK